VTRRFKIAANGGSIIGSFIRGPRARGAHTKSQHYRAMRSVGFAWDVAWTGRWSVHQLGLSWGCVGQPVRGWTCLRRTICRRQRRVQSGVEPRPAP